MEEVVIYKTLHDFAPSSEEIKDGYIAIKADDQLEVTKTDQFEEECGGNIQKPKAWLEGSNMDTNERGYFPGPYVEFVKVTTKVSNPPPLPPHRPVPKTRLSLAKTAIKEVPCNDDSGYVGTPQGFAQGLHSLTEFVVIRPQICPCCKDYIFSSHEGSFKCDGCHQCFHNSCRTHAISLPCRINEKQEEINIQMPVEEWSSMHVMEWMAAINLHRYAELFNFHNISGADLLVMTEDKLHSMKITDELHSLSIILCLDDLCHRSSDKVTSKYSSLLPAKSEPILGEGYSACNHRLLEYSFTSLQSCHLCGQFLLGLYRQGLQCRGMPAAREYDRGQLGPVSG